MLYPFYALALGTAPHLNAIILGTPSCTPFARVDRMLPAWADDERRGRRERFGDKGWEGDRDRDRLVVCVFFHLSDFHTCSWLRFFVAYLGMILARGRKARANAWKGKNLHMKCTEYDVCNSITRV